MVPNHPLVERNLTQSSRALNTGLRASPLPVSPYSTFGGTCGCIVRRTIPSRSSPRSCWISIFCEIFGMALSNSEGRRMEFAHKREIIIIFHRPSKHARAFSISLAHMSRCSFLKFFFRGAMLISPSLCLALWYVHAFLKTHRRGGPVIRIVESPSIYRVKYRNSATGSCVDSYKSLSKVIGRLVNRLPVAWYIAFATAAATPVMGISPIPCAPIGVCGSGISVYTMSMCGTSACTGR